MVSILRVMLCICFATAPAAVFAFGNEKAKSASEIDLKDPMTVRARVQPSQVEVGGTFELHLDLELAKGYHAYYDRLKLSIESPDDLKLAPFKLSPVTEFRDPVTKSQKKGIEGKAFLRAVIEVPTGFTTGRHALKLKFTHQSCTDEFCLFPKSILIEVPFHAVGDTSGAKLALSPPQAVSPATNEKHASSGNEFKNALDKGLLPALLLVFAVGFLTCLTPCIYPMIPITLAVLGARAKDHSHLKNFSIALVYVLGIATTYSLLGLVAASTGGLFGSALGSPWVIGTLALMFVAMGLSMFGLFEVQAPAFIRNKLGAGTGGRGYGGAFATGLVAGIVASPCIGPVLVSLLAYIAQTKSHMLGFGMLFVFALGMGVPFIALGLSSSLLTRLPKSGPWMESVKSFFGIVMFGMAFYYVKPLAPAWLFQALLGLAIVLLASVFGAFTPNVKLDVPGRIRKGLMVTALATGALLCATGILSRAGVLVPGSSFAGGPQASPMKWQPYSHAAVAEAAKSKRPVLIDFMAEWCGACKEMDESTFIDSRVVALSNQFTLLRVDGTEDTPALREILERYKVRGFPTYLFFDISGTLRSELTGLGYENAEAFMKRMQAAGSEAKSAGL